MDNRNSVNRILCVFSTLDRGGAESMCMNLYRHIDKTKVQFDFVKHTHDIGAFENEIKELGGNIYEAPRYKVINTLKYRKWWKKFFEKHPEYNIIHGHFFTIASVFLDEAKKANKITIGHSHCTNAYKVGNNRLIINSLKLRLIKNLKKYSDYCFACSNEAGKWIFNNKEFMVLNNAIDTELYKFQPVVRQRIREKMNIEENFVVGTVGRIMHQKNPNGIIDIFMAIKEKQPNAKLMWIGKGPGSETVEARIKSLGIQDSVMMMGVRSDVNELLQAMDVFIFPSFYEGLGVSAVEAQTAGLQCFCSNKIPKEVALTNRCYFLPLGQPNEWADQILNTKCDHIDTQQQIIDAGYDVHQTSEWLQNFYQEISEK